MSHAPNLKLISGTRHPELAKEVANALGVKLTETSISKFADGEIHTKIEESIRGDDVFVIQPTSCDVNEALMELLIMIDALKRASAGRITAVIPYYGYARQDRKATSREPISAKLVANLLEKSGADRVLVIDLHAAQVQGFFDIPVDNLDALPILVRHMMDKSLTDVTIVSPDVGGVKRARAMAKLLCAPIAIIDKRRTHANCAEVMNVIGEVAGKDCILIDDMIDTAGTITEAAKALKEGGAGRIFACAVHSVLSGPGLERLTSSVIEEVVFTNTIPIAKNKMAKNMTVLSVAPLLAKAIRCIHVHVSISTLFDEILNDNCTRG
ncbi:ribose-phosphate pyrophosphokinase [Candidatus Woesearchaeota archaeon CG11_big_fil_rev_8_21_14_0_20_43_8]|nr:MAG: ribose-phosphate pyrophosphokinase [Candidatus Woesearchaeota archaeon CG11_big_fil_rev_8_21_14_0_20_43_8]PIO05735.1 MAG: ribose-phosphate pyrophosphokinase [Candidatus Woesearchaeota archaeon CG08_land_8_20_14_0_20_43_7]